MLETAGRRCNRRGSVKTTANARNKHGGASGKQISRITATEEKTPQNPENIKHTFGETKMTGP